MKVLGSVGHPIKDTEFKIVDPETGSVLPPGSKGIVKVRGPPVMKGYYKVIHTFCSLFTTNLGTNDTTIAEF